MSTYLELCRDSERESGVISPSSLIQSVTDARNRSAKTVAWVRQAWVEIQNRRTDWLFLRKEFTDVALVVDQGRYVAATHLAITDHAAWLADSNDYRVFTIRDSTAPERDDSELFRIDWEIWRRNFGRGQESGRPTWYAISPQGEFCLGPVPDKAYLLSGEYRRSAQVLTANIDVPICPADFHALITWRSLLMANGHDEASQTALAHAQSNFATLFTSMVRSQTPRITLDREPIG